MARPHNHKLIEKLESERDDAVRMLIESQGEVIRLTNQLAATRAHPWRNLWRRLRARF